LFRKRWVSSRRDLAIALIAGSLVGLFFFNYEPILLFIGDFLIVKDELKPADMIHVIAGEDYRTDYAIQLYQEGYAGQIFFTGGWCSKHQVNHAEHGKELSLRWRPFLSNSCRIRAAGGRIGSQNIWLEMNM
jgi:hypothetical protein